MATTRRARHTAHATFALALLLGTLAACGAPNDDPPTGGTGAVTTTIDRSGGTLEARNDDGTRLRLTIPPNATAEPIQITLTPLPTNTSIARFELQPYGLRLRLPIEYRLTLPEPAPDGATLLLAQGTTRVPTDTQRSTDRRTLTATTPQLGYPTTPLDTARLRPHDDDPPTSGPIEVDPVACAQAITHLNETRRPNREGWLFTVAEAEALLQARLTALQACTTPNDLTALNAETELLQEAACSRLLGATVDALTLYIPALGANIDDLWTYTEALLVHAATIDLTGGTCPHRPELEDTLDTLINRYADAYPIRIANLDTDFWRLIWSTEMRNLDRLLSAAHYFDLPTTTQDRLRDLAGDLLDALHPRAFERCRDENTQGYLADLLNGGGHLGRPIWPIPDEVRGNTTANDLKRDIQHCATSLTITPFNELAEPIPNATLTLGARTPPNTPLTNATLILPTDGALQLSGELRPLRCEAYRQPPRFSNDTIAVLLDHTEIARWTFTNANHLNPTRDLALSDILETAGLPEDATGTLTLTLRRQGEACEGTYGDDDTELYAIELVINPGTVQWGQAALLAVAGGSIGVSCLTTGITEREEQRLTDLPATSHNAAAAVTGDLHGTDSATGGTCSAELQANATASLSVHPNAMGVRVDGTITATGSLSTSVTGEATSSGAVESATDASSTFTVSGTVPYALTYSASTGGTTGQGGLSRVVLERVDAPGGTVVLRDLRAPIGSAVGGTVEGLLTAGTYRLGANGSLQAFACSEGEPDLCGKSDPAASTVTAQASFSLELRGALQPPGDGVGSSGRP